MTMSLLSLGAVGDKVWDDADGDGVQDAGEAGLGGVTVRLLDSGNAVLGTTTTAADGTYQFPDLSAGSFRVEFVPAQGRLFSPRDQGGNDTLDSDADPATGRSPLFTIGPGQQKLDIDAGFVMSAPGVPVVTIEATDPWGWEDGSLPAEFTVRRTGDTSAPLMVSLSVAGTATGGADYTLVNVGPGGTLTIPAGSASAPLGVAVIDDLAVEGSETVTVSPTVLPGGAYVVGTPGIDTVTIVDDDLIVSVVATDPYASEVGPNTGTFTVTRNSTAGALTVYYYEDGPAIPDHGSGAGDYAGLPGTPGLTHPFEIGERALAL
jgi:hypothetical protein